MKTLNIRKAAQILNFAEKTIRREMRASKLEVARIGREYRVNIRNFDAYWQRMGGGDLFVIKDLDLKEQAQE